MLDQHREAANWRQIIEENLKEKLALKKCQMDLEESKLNILEKKSVAEIKEKNLMMTAIAELVKSQKPDTQDVIETTAE